MTFYADCWFTKKLVFHFDSENNEKIPYKIKTIIDKKKDGIS